MSTKITLNQADANLKNLDSKVLDTGEAVVIADEIENQVRYI